jgi:hypothetical protein
MMRNHSGTFVAQREHWWYGVFHSGANVVSVEWPPVSHAAGNKTWVRLRRITGGAVEQNNDWPVQNPAEAAAGRVVVAQNLVAEVQSQAVADQSLLAEADQSPLAAG